MIQIDLRRFIIDFRDLSDDDYEFVHNEVKINRLREKEIEIQIELIDNLRF